MEEHMDLKRRDFLGIAAAAGSAAITPRALRAQAPSGAANVEAPTYKAKVEKLFKTPDRYPNALEAMPMPSGLAIRFQSGSTSLTGRPERSWRTSSQRRTTRAVSR